MMGSAKITTLATTQDVDTLRTEIAKAHALRVVAEDQRANKRNRNRAYMLLSTITITLAMNVIMRMMGLSHLLVMVPVLPTLIAYAFDLLLTGWSWARKL